MSGRLSSGGWLAVVVPAAAALLAVTVAACNPATSSAAAGGNGGEAAAATAAASSPAADSPAANPPAQTSAAAQGNPDFPYEPGGVTISNDEGGVYTFSLPAGAYSQNTTASYDPALDPDDSGQCLFSGEFDLLTSSGWSVLGPLGVTVPITTGIYGPPVAITLAAGDYRVYIYPETTCSWTFTLAP